MGTQTRPSYDGSKYGYADYVRPTPPERSEFEKEMIAIREEQRNYLNSPAVRLRMKEATDRDAERAAQ